MHTQANERPTEKDGGSKALKPNPILEKTRGHLKTLTKTTFQSNIGFLQRMAARQFIDNCIAQRRFQSKLTVNQPEDKYEQEAEWVAKQIMQMPELQTCGEASSSAQHQAIHNQRACTMCTGEKHGKPLNKKEDGEEVLQTKAIEGDTPQHMPTSETYIHICGLLSRGQPIRASNRAFFEARFGHDFSQVRIHTDSHAAEAARSVSAKAFTIGKDVFFGAGQYAPNSPGGRQLLAHELTHVLQQNGAVHSLPNMPPKPRHISLPARRKLEVTDSKQQIMRTPAEDFVSEHSGIWGLDERRLGYDLRSRIQHENYRAQSIELVYQVFIELSGSDRNQVAFYFINDSTSEFRRRVAGSSESGRRLMRWVRDLLWEVSGDIFFREGDYARHASLVSEALAWAESRTEEATTSATIPEVLSSIEEPEFLVPTEMSSALSVEEGGEEQEERAIRSVSPIEYSFQAQIQPDQSILSYGDRCVILTVNRQQVQTDQPFAYQFLPPELGRNYPIIRLVISPGVRIERRGFPRAHILDETNPSVEIYRVQDPGLVPHQGEPIWPSHFVGLEEIGSMDFPAPQVTTIRRRPDGVDIIHTPTGVSISITVPPRSSTGRFAYEVLPPDPSAQRYVTHITAVATPSTIIRIRGMRLGEYRADPLIRLYEAPRLIDVPAQGQSLSPVREIWRDWPGRRVEFEPEPLSQIVATSAAEIAIGAIPLVGDFVDVAEFVYGLFAGCDRWGRPLTATDLALIGIGALIPFVGATVLREGATAVRRVDEITELAQAMHRNPDELIELVSRVGRVTDAEQGQIIRWRSVIERGEAIPEDELPDFQRILGQVNEALPSRRAVGEPPRLGGGQPPGGEPPVGGGGPLRRRDEPQTVLEPNPVDVTPSGELVRRTGPEFVPIPRTRQAGQVASEIEIYSRRLAPPLITGQSTQLLNLATPPARSLEEINAAIDSLLEGILVTLPDARRVDEAREALRTAIGTSGSLEESTSVIIEQIVTDFRMLNIDTPEGLLRWRDICGSCGGGRDIPAISLETLARNSSIPVEIRRFQFEEVERAFGSGHDPARIPRHGFLIISFQSNPPIRYLVDPTFGQFLRPPHPPREYTFFAESLRDDPERASFAEELVQNGFIRLDRDNASNFAGYYAEGMNIPREEVLRSPDTYLNFENWRALDSEIIGGQEPQSTLGARRGPLINPTETPLPEGVPLGELLGLVPENQPLDLVDASDVIINYLNGNPPYAAQLIDLLRRIYDTLEEILRGIPSGNPRRSDIETALNEIREALSLQ